MIRLLRNALLGLGLLGGLACGLLSPEKSFPNPHPSTLGMGQPVCTDCHEEGLKEGSSMLYSSFNHSPAFARDHKLPANRDSATCATCHPQSFCADCHTGKGVVSPALKLADRPDRISPHRGGYMTLHRIDGKMDPTSCYKCHGRSNNQTCIACHR
ncbi:MAG: lipoprotein cytochrome c, 5 heme-binding site [Holophagaceae bacterium]|nr:lipoprotein cytochrome c, 5 heme-binding site [Holophagaceae bacterium]